MKQNHFRSLYLAQSYQDAWEDYQRSLRSASFPVWDYVVITASNEHQAEGFRSQIENRKECGPSILRRKWRKTATSGYRCRITRIPTYRIK